jgi:acetyltransferase-like isoleucine patch superfamily enzyme
MAGPGFALRQGRQFFRRRVEGVALRFRAALGGAYVEPDLSVVGMRRIHLESGVVIQRRAALSTRPGSRLIIGAGSRIGSDAVISVAREVRFGREVLVAARCFISDHNHQFADPSAPVLRQGSTPPAPVVIGDGCWLGINVCILAGVTLGRNCVVAANSVVTQSFPDGSVLGGAPARLLRTAGTAE